MIDGNQNFEGVGMAGTPLSAGTLTLNNPAPNVGIGYREPIYAVDQDRRNKEIVLVLQVQFPEIYAQIADVLRAKDALIGSNQW